MCSICSAVVKVGPVLHGQDEGDTLKDKTRREGTTTREMRVKTRGTFSYIGLLRLMLRKFTDSLSIYSMQYMCQFISKTKQGLGFISHILILR